MIEPTEGLTVVDVNSGKFKTKSSPEDAAFMVNMEAAPEIARQLRLRDVGGIIVIDFIDMSKEGHKRKVLETLEDALAKDRSKTEVNRISQLGLVEMTRERTGKALESFSFVECPYCDGRGRVRLGVSKLPFHDHKDQKVHEPREQKTQEHREQRNQEHRDHQGPDHREHRSPEHRDHRAHEHRDQRTHEHKDHKAQEQKDEKITPEPKDQKVIET